MLAALVRKYGGEPGEPAGIDGVRRWADTAASVWSELDVSDEALAALRGERERRRATVAARGGRARLRAGQAAGRLAAAVTGELAGLAMPGARLIIEVRPRAVTSTAETVEIDGQPTRRSGRTGSTRSRSCSRRARAPRRCRWAAARPAASCPG